MKIAGYLATAGLAALATIGVATSASAVTTTSYGFADFAADGQGGDTVQDQFTLSVMQGLSGGVDFTISNDADSYRTPVATFVGIEDANGILTFGSIDNSDGVNFSTPNGNNSLPQTGTSYDDFSYKSVAGVNGGIADGESLTLSFGLTGTTTFADVLAGLQSGTLGFGLHIQSIDGLNGGDGSSDVIVSSVPVPAGLPLLLAGLGALGLVRRRKAAA